MEIPQTKPTNVERLANVLAVFGEHALETRPLGNRGVFLPLPVAEEVSRRLDLLAEIERRGYL